MEQIPCALLIKWLLSTPPSPSQNFNCMPQFACILVRLGSNDGNDNARHSSYFFSFFLAYLYARVGNPQEKKPVFLPQKKWHVAQDALQFYWVAAVLPSYMSLLSHGKLVIVWWTASNFVFARRKSTKERFLFVRASRFLRKTATSWKVVLCRRASQTRNYNLFGKTCFSNCWRKFPLYK